MENYSLEQDNESFLVQNNENQVTRERDEVDENFLEQNKENQVTGEQDEVDDLFVGKSFESWEEVMLFLDRYCKRQGFGYRKGRSKRDKNEEITTKRTFLCRHSGIFTSNKTTSLNNQRDRVSCRVDCPWHLNINKNSEDIYIVTTFINKHQGHTLSSDAGRLLPQFRQLTETMLADIKF